MGRSTAWRALAALTVAEIAGFAAYAGRVGFYHDDWALLDAFVAAGGFWARVATMSWSAPRPLDMLLYPALYAVGGMNPLAQHVLRMGVELACAFFFYLLLARLTRMPRFSLASAALALLVPNHDVIHFWFGIANESWAVALMFASLLCHLDWIETGRRSKLAASLSLYLASVLCYEALAFFPLVLLARQGSWRALLPYGPTLLAALLWQRVGVALLLHAPNTKTAGLSPLHMLKVFGAGFECVSNRVLHISWLSLRGAAKAFSWAQWLACAAATALVAVPLAAGEADDLRSTRVATVFGLAAFVAAYAPYAFTADYMPQTFGIMSRTNAGGAWIAGMLFAAVALAAGRARLPALAAVVFVFIAADWYRGLQWARSWDVQQEIMAAMKAKSGALPRGATVLLTGAPKEIEWALVFDASWDFDGALRVATGRRDLKGDILGRAPHDEQPLFVYDHATGVLKPATSSSPKR
jgi:hypothetical protein